MLFKFSIMTKNTPTKINVTVTALMDANVIHVFPRLKTLTQMAPENFNHKNHTPLLTHHAQ